jgi:hypothetical protein
MGLNVLIPCGNADFGGEFHDRSDCHHPSRSPQQKLLTIELIDFLRCLDRRTDAGDVPPL